MQENKNNNTLSIDVRPKSDIYTIFRNLTYNITSAISELIDNSIASFRENIDSLKIREIIICFNNNRNNIIVVDTAGGISSDNIPRSLKLKERPKNIKGLNEFGMGLKTSAFWFGEELKIKTLSIKGNKNEYSLNLAKLEKGISEVPVYDYNNPLPIFRNSNHGTCIQINQIVRNMTYANIESLVQKLESKYRKDIEKNKINIRILLQEKKGKQWVDVVASYYKGEKVKQDLNSIDLFEKLSYKKPEYYKDENKIWVDTINDSFKYFSTKENKYKTIRYNGEIFIKKKFNRKNYVGFDLMRRDIVILPNYKDPAILGGSGTFKYARLSGYIELNDLDVNQQKDNFEWDEEMRTLFHNSLRKNATYKKYAQKADSIRERSDIDPQKWNVKRKEKSNKRIEILAKQINISKDIINVKVESYKGQQVDVARQVKIGELSWNFYMAWKSNAKNIISVTKDDKERILYAEIDINLKIFNPINREKSFIEFITLFFIAYLKSYIECNEYGRSVEEFHNSFIESLRELNDN